MSHGVSRCKPQNSAISPAWVNERLERAGATLLALAVGGYSPGLKIARYEIVRSALEAYGYERETPSAAAPSPADIRDMDEVLGWTSRLLPALEPGLRRVIGYRMLVDPVSGRHRYSWRRCAALLGGVSHHTAAAWHAQALALIAAGLERERGVH